MEVINYIHITFFLLNWIKYLKFSKIFINQFKWSYISAFNNVYEFFHVGKRNLENIDDELQIALFFQHSHGLFNFLQIIY